MLFHLSPLKHFFSVLSWVFIYNRPKQVSFPFVTTVGEHRKQNFKDKQDLGFHSCLEGLS